MIVSPLMKGGQGDVYLGLVGIFAMPMEHPPSPLRKGDFKTSKK